jgi:hypothetical protein
LLDIFNCALPTTPRSIHIPVTFYEEYVCCEEGKQKLVLHMMHYIASVEVLTETVVSWLGFEPRASTVGGAL